MTDSRLKKEFSSLILDVKEQLLYLQELGVENLSANHLPDIEQMRLSKNDRKVSVISGEEESERFTQSKDITKKTASGIQKTTKGNAKSRRKILNSTKLSSFSAAERKSSYSRQTKTPIKSREEGSAKNTSAIKETRLKDTLFGDITEQLPESSETLEQVREDIGQDCSRCRLCENRTQVVNSDGHPNADLMFIGEAPGVDEDKQGKPFVGRAGKLLTKIIEAIDLKRDDVFIGNINRCRPPENRQPQIDEAEICKPFLLREISIVSPKVIVVMGNTACQNLLDTKAGITKLRGNFRDFFGIKVMPTFHPAYLLRDPRKKREVWEDMKIVRDFLTES